MTPNKLHALIKGLLNSSFTTPKIKVKHIAKHKNNTKIILKNVPILDIIQKILWIICSDNFDKTQKIMTRNHYMMDAAPNNILKNVFNACVCQHSTPSLNAVIQFGYSTNA